MRSIKSTKKLIRYCKKTVMRCWMIHLLFKAHQFHWRNCCQGFCTKQYTVIKSFVCVRSETSELFCNFLSTFYSQFLLDSYSPRGIENIAMADGSRALLMKQMSSNKSFSFQGAVCTESWHLQLSASAARGLARERYWMSLRRFDKRARSGAIHSSPAEIIGF